MGLCKSIEILSLELERQLTDLNVCHRSLLNALQEMPSYLNKGDLSEWQELYCNELEDNAEDGFHGQLIEMLYDLASFNLFGKFNPKETKRVYLKVIQETSKSGIILSGNLDVSGW